MKFFDSHSHYNDEKFENDLEEIIKATFDQGVAKFMCVGYNLESSNKAIEIAEKYDNIYASCGISPNDLDCIVDEESSGNIYNNLNNKLNEIEKMAENPKVVAIGEIGLDYYWEKSEEKRNFQKELFIKQIELANKLDLPIIIHTRDAYLDTIKINLGYYISFSGVITYKNAKPELPVETVPLNRILIETDSPYLSPEPYRGKRNDSRRVIEIARKIASIKNQSLDEIARITFENAEKVFKLKDISCF